MTDRLPQVSIFMVIEVHTLKSAERTIAYMKIQQTGKRIKISCAQVTFVPSIAYKRPSVYMPRIKKSRKIW